MKKEIAGRIILIGIVLLGLIFRTFRLDFHSLWADELCTWYSAWQPSFIRFWTIYSESELTPPLYFFLQFFNARIFEASEIALRWPSVAFGTLYIFNNYVLARELGGRRAGLIAALVTATSYRAIAYSQEARSYSLLFVLASFLTWAWVRMIKTQKWKWYATLGGLISYTHYYGILLILSQAFSLLIFWRWKKQKLVIMVKAYSLCAALFLPWLIYLWAMPVPEMHLHKRPLPPLDEFFVAHRELFGGSSANSTLATLLAFFGIFSVKGEARRLRLSLLLSVPAIFLLCWIISLKEPIYSSRYFTITLSAMLVAAALGLADLRRYHWALPILGTLIFSSLGLHETVIARQYYTQPRAEQIRESTQLALNWLDQNPGSELVLLDMEPNSFGFYLQKSRFTSQPFASLPSSSFRDASNWPAKLRTAKVIVILAITYLDRDSIFQNIPPGFRLIQRQDFNLASAGLIEKL